MIDDIKKLFEKNYQEYFEPKNFSRKSALDTFVRLGIPKWRSEEWKYTDISKLNEVTISIENNFEDDYIKKAVADCDVSPYKLVFCNGKFQDSFSNILNQNGLEIKVVKSFEDIKNFCDDIGSIADYSEESFVALNSSCFADCVLIRVLANREIQDLIQVINISTSNNSTNLSCPRLFIETEKNSKLNIIETYISLDSNNQSLTCPVSEYKLAENSEIKVYKVVKDGQDNFHIGMQEALCAKNSRFYNTVFNLSGGTVRNNTNCKLNGELAYASLLGLSVLKDSEKVDNVTKLDHSMPNCDSYEVYKGIFNDESQGVFNGTIIVRKDAQKTNAIQSNKAILLSKKAASYAKPQLKIWADDVKCTHGATCGALDDEAMFYLRSRGISENEAKNILVQAFAGEITESVTDKALKEWLGQEISKKL